MELNYQDLRSRLRTNPDAEIKIWVCNFCQRNLIGRISRNVQPTYVRVYLHRGELAFQTESRKEIAYNTNTHGSGLRMFEMYDECVGKYNEMINACLDSNRSAALKLQQQVEKIEKFLMR